MNEIRKYIDIVESYLLESSNIKEDVEYDRKKRMVAYEIIEGLHRELSEHGLTRFHYSSNNRNYSFTINSGTLGLNHLFKNKSFKIVIEGNVVNSGYYGLYRLKTREIVVMLPRRLSNEIRNNMSQDNPIIDNSSNVVYEITKYLYTGNGSSTLFHEIIHAYDDLVGKWLKKANIKSTDKGTLADHSNRHSEISTRTAQIIYDFEKLIRTSQANELIMRDRLGKSFDEWIDFNKTRNRTFMNVVPHLEEKNKKRLFSRLFQYWDTYIKGEKTIDKAIVKSDNKQNSSLLKKHTSFDAEYILDGENITINLYEEEELIGYSEGAVSKDGVISEILFDFMEDIKITIDSELYIEYIEYVTKSEEIINGMIYAIIDFAIDNGIEIILAGYVDYGSNQLKQQSVQKGFKSYTNSEDETIYYYLNI